MKFKNYCIVIIGNTDGVYSEIESISENKPNVVDGKGLLIATFTSVNTVKELDEQFKFFNRNFLLFELNPNSSGFNITKENIHEGLFGFLRDFTDDKLRDRTEALIREINSTAETKDKQISFKTKKTPVEKEKKITDKDLAEMSKKQKEELFDKLFSNIENLSDYDKEILQKLAI